MKRKRFLFWPVSVLILLFGSYSPVLSQENIKLGFLELRPFVKASEVFTDNILQTKEEKKHASISTLTPGLEIRIPISWHLLRLEYHNDFHHISNLNQNSTNHSVATNLELNFPGGLLSKVRERYFQSIYPDSTERTGLVKRSQNDMLFELGYKFTDRWVVKGGYYSTIHNYQESEAEDRIVHKGGGTLMLRILSRTSLLAEIQGGTTGYRRIPDRNFSFQNGLFGAQSQLTPKTNILLKVGLQHQSYQQARVSDFTRFIADFSLLNKFSPFTSFSATFTQESVESFWLSNAYYTSSNASLGINRKFRRKFSVTLNFPYGLNKYHQEELLYGTSKLRRDTILGFGLDLLYEIQQSLKLGAGYMYRSRDSNFPFDYSENRVSLSAAVVF
jgi:hypothetical protein